MAFKNVSNNEKTVKNMYRMGSSDNWTLARTTVFMKYQTNTIIPYYNILDNFRDYFIPKLVTINLDEKFYYQPTKFAEYYYGDPLLDWIVLYFSNIPTLFEFNKPTIKVLPVTCMNDINQIIVKYRNTVAQSNTNPINFTVDKLKR